jgi:hypothetical protein
MMEKLPLSSVEPVALVSQTARNARGAPDAVPHRHFFGFDFAVQDRHERRLFLRIVTGSLSLYSNRSPSWRRQRRLLLTHRRIEASATLDARHGVHRDVRLDWRKALTVLCRRPHTSPSRTAATARHNGHAAVTVTASASDRPPSSC